MKKYKILKDRSDTLYDGTVVYRIQALRDFSNVKQGDIGGWIQQESNLSQDGNCWVYDDALVYEFAIVSDNAKIYNDAMVYGNANIFGNDIVTKDVLFVNTILKLTLTDNHIYYGDIKKTIQEWKEWLKNKFELEYGIYYRPNSDTNTFEIMKSTLEYAFRYDELR